MQTEIDPIRERTSRGAFLMRTILLSQKEQKPGAAPGAELREYILA